MAPQSTNLRTSDSRLLQRSGQINNLAAKNDHQNRFAHHLRNAHTMMQSFSTHLTASAMSQKNVPLRNQRNGTEKRHSPRSDDQMGFVAAGWMAIRNSKYWSGLLTLDCPPNGARRKQRAVTMWCTQASVDHEQNAWRLQKDALLGVAIASPPCSRQTFEHFLVCKSWVVISLG